jgi:hypothetical protein
VKIGCNGRGAGKGPLLKAGILACGNDISHFLHNGGAIRHGDARTWQCQGVSRGEFTGLRVLQVAGAVLLHTATTVGLRVPGFRGVMRLAALVCCPGKEGLGLQHENADHEENDKRPGQY